MLSDVVLERVEGINSLIQRITDHESHKPAIHSRNLRSPFCCQLRRSSDFTAHIDHEDIPVFWCEILNIFPLGDWIIHVDTSVSHQLCSWHKSGCASKFVHIL